MSKKTNPNSYADASYAVGRGKPPRHSQFKPGQSGNPNGRKRKSAPNSKAELRALIDEPVTVRSASGEHQIPALTAMLMQVRKTVLQSGSPAQLLKFLRILDQLGVLSEADVQQVQGVLVVPGRSASAEEWERDYGEPLRRNHEQMDRELQQQLTNLKSATEKLGAPAPKRRARVPGVTRPPSLVDDLITRKPDPRSIMKPRRHPGVTVPRSLLGPSRDAISPPTDPVGEN